jgi:hypothetical protein
MKMRWSTTSPSPLRLTIVTAGTVTWESSNFV